MRPKINTFINLGKVVGSVEFVIISVKNKRTCPITDKNKKP